MGRKPITLTMSDKPCRKQIYSLCSSSLISAYRKDNVPSRTAPRYVTFGRMQLVSNVSEEIDSQLHNDIMKASRRLALDEIIGNVIVDFVAKKKAWKQLKTEQESNGVRRPFLKDEKHLKHES